MSKSLKEHHKTHFHGIRSVKADIASNGQNNTLLGHCCQLLQ